MQSTKSKKSSVFKVSDKISIWEVKDFVTADECDKLIDLSEKKGFVNSEVQSGKDANDMHMKTKARNSKTSYVGNINSNPINTIFGNKARQIIKKLGNLSDEEVNSYHMEGLQVQKYKTGEKYNPHFDTFSFKDGVEQRNWTVMVYLNEDESNNPLEGGCTYFQKLDLRVCPQKGKAVVWNNLTEDGCRDEYTLHMGEEVRSGTKLIVTIWFRKSANSLLCKNPNFFNPKHPQSLSSKQKTEDLLNSKNFTNDSEYYYIWLALVFILVFISLGLYLSQ